MHQILELPNYVENYQRGARKLVKGQNNQHEAGTFRACLIEVSENQEQYGMYIIHPVNSVVLTNIRSRGDNLDCQHSRNRDERLLWVDSKRVTAPQGPNP